MTAYPIPPPPAFLPTPHNTSALSINLPPPSSQPHYQHYPLPPTPPAYFGQGRGPHRRASGEARMTGMRRNSGGLRISGHGGPIPTPFHSSAPVQIFPSFPYDSPHPTYSLPHHSPIPHAGPRPHPHLTSTDLYISNVPADMPEVAIVDALRDCLPVRIKLNMPVDPKDRLKPDAYYDWMPRAGTLHFTNLHSAEKALAILVAHPFMAHAGLIVSTRPPPTSPYDLPQIPPFPNPPVAARYLRPTLQVIPTPSIDIKDAATALSTQVPSLGELFDIIRPWGSLRQISVWFEEGPPSELGPALLSWSARVVFWHEDEARQFEHGFGGAGLLIKGWQIFIFAEQVLPPPPPHAHDPDNIPLPTTPRLFSQVEHPHLQIANTAINSSNVDPEIFRRMGLPIYTAPNTPNFGPVPQYMTPPSPLTPSTEFIPAPWANHNISASRAMTKSQSYDRRSSVPTGSNMVPLGLRRSMSQVQIGQTGVAHRRTWSITLSNSLEGELMPSGIIADDGTVIHHGPGQNLRPSPLTGPGATSSSGLVDYSNVFVKNLDPDINSFALDDIFSNVGRIVSAKVMRDDEGRSRGYGFVSFYSPNEAAHAIQIMNNTKVGSQQIAVTLHEPRKLRPDKQAERYANSSDITSGPGARPISPTRNVKRVRNMRAPVESSFCVETVDSIRLLSGEDRKLALSRFVTGPVAKYARTHNVPESCTEPAIRALVAHDLALLFLLVAPKRLEGRIAETFAILQADPDYAIELHTSQIPLDASEPLFSPNPSSSSPLHINILTEADLRAKLIVEVAKIDPFNAEPVVDILWNQLQPSDRIRATHHRGFLASKYGSAKRQLLLQREQELSTPTAAEGSSDTSSSTSPPPSAITSSDTGTSIASDAPLTSPSQVVYLALDEIRLDTLAARSALEIMAHLSSASGTDILQKLGMSRPTSDEAGQLARWILAVRDKAVLQRDAEITAMVAKHFQASWGKKLSQLKVARGMVEREDTEALCKLIAYPQLLDAKARLFYSSMEV